MAPTKKTSKDKKRPTENQNTEEPALEDLVASVEQQAKKRTRRESTVTSPTQTATASSSASVLKAPEALSNDLIQEMRFELDSMRRLRTEHQQEMIQIQAKLAAKQEDNYQWQKDGNRKQFTVMQKIIESAVQSKAVYRAAGQQAGETQLMAVINTATERIKILKIADSSPHGWGTVSEYEANPITQDDEDNKKLKKAEKAAQEKALIRAQERKAKQTRFANYNSNNSYQGTNRGPNRGYDNRDSTSPRYKAFGGFKSGNSFKSSTVVPDKPLPKRNVNNDICYACGNRGHWANSCPELKKDEPNTPKECKYIIYSLYCHRILCHNYSMIHAMQFLPHSYDLI